MVLNQLAIHTLTLHSHHMQKSISDEILDLTMKGLLEDYVGEQYQNNEQKYII